LIDGGEDIARVTNVGHGECFEKGFGVTQRTLGNGFVVRATNS
jgi:hypothetical protein